MPKAEGCWKTSERLREQMCRGESRVTADGFYQRQKNFDLIYLFCVAEGKPGNLLGCETNKEKRNGGTLSLNPEARLWINIPIPLRPVGVSSEGCRGRRPVAVDQYSSSLCLPLVWAGNNFILIF